MKLLFIWMANVAISFTVEGGIELQQVTNDNSLIVIKLKPHTKYEFFAIAHNSKRSSRHSEIVTQITDDDGNFTSMGIYVYIHNIW